MSDDAHGRKIEAVMRAGLGFVEFAGLSIAVVALVDRLFGFGWGYELTTIFLGLGIMLGGVILYFACLAIFAIARSGK